MKVLALDQASTTGWAVFNNAQLIAYGTFKVSDMKSFYEFLKGLESEYGIESVLYEGIYATRNIATFKKLAMYQGVVLTAFPDAEEIYPSEWRSIVELRARGRQNQKRAAVQMVEELYGVKTNQDSAEAVLIGHSKVSQELNFE